MRSLTLSLSVVLTLVVVAMASDSGTSGKTHYDLNKASDMFEDFIKEHNRQYKDDEDKQIHYRAFVASLEKINTLNAQSTSATYGLNKFADYTDEEKQTMFGHGRKKE